MATPDAALGGSETPVRISKIAGRYLVFDPDAAALLRRRDNISGTLVGTTPQQPTQNVFLGLPVELRPEEVDALIRRHAAYVIDAATAHRSNLSHPDANSRRTYKESLRRGKDAAQRATSDRNARRAAEVASRFGRHNAPTASLPSPVSVHDDSRGDAQPRLPELDNAGRPTANSVNIWGITPMASGTLASPPSDKAADADAILHGPLCRFLQSSGYYMTPGLRFGARYSVYPGDPLRFHAHFMANQYGWNDEIPMLDVVSGGRLATAVKKAFLMGGQQLPTASLPDPRLCTISVEWAAM